MAGLGIRTRAFVVACALLAVLPAGASASTGVSPRIVGGTSAANPGWIAYLDIAFSDGHSLCGGELISKQWVLTAAHCVTNDGGTTAVAPDAVTAWIGLNNLSDSDTDPGVSVDQVVVDPAYNITSLDGDVALLHLTSPSSHEPVPLGGPSDPAVGSVPAVLGWGITDSVTQVLSDALLRVAAPVLPPSMCAALEPGYDATSKICAGGTQGQDSCNGDSGGPLVLAAGTSVATLVGTVDYGSEICGDGQPAVYQRVTSGSVESFIEGIAPMARITSGIPFANQQVTLQATAGHLLATPSYAWDLDADGQFDDATGNPVSVPLGTTGRSVAVRMTADNGEIAMQRLTITPVFRQVAIAPPADVREGALMQAQIQPVQTALGTVHATLSGAGMTPVTLSRAVAGTPFYLTFRAPDDHVWDPSGRTLTLSIATEGLRLTTPATFAVQLLDNDAPKLDLVRVKRRGARAFAVTFHAPGAGRVSLDALSGKRRMAHKRVAIGGAGERTLVLRLSKADQRRLRGRKPVIKAGWRSTPYPAYTASASRRAPRLPRLVP